MQLQFLSENVLDIVSVKRDSKSKKNVLLEFDKLYTKHVNGKKGCLFSNMQITQAVSEGYVTVTITLLPHQILLMPESYRESVVDLNVDEQNLQFLDYESIQPLLRNSSFVTLTSNDPELEESFLEQKENSFVTNSNLISIYFNKRVCGIGWNLDKIENFTSIGKFDIDSCKQNLMFTIDVTGVGSFPRIVQTNESDADDDDDVEPEYDYYADFGILNLESNGFQTTTLPMNFDSVDYNWFAGGQSVINEEYTNALESRVEQMYRDSWICQYFDYEPKCEDGIVFFYNKIKKQKVDTFRFNVNEYIPANSRPYFLPKSEWAISSNEDGVVFCRTKLLSNEIHGFKVTPCYSTKSLFYTAPFFLVFRTSPSVKSNYLMFTNFLKPNSETTILAMLLYNETDDVFVPQFLPDIILPYLKNLSLNNVLEFKLYDADLNQVQIADSSQLFVTLALMP